MQHRIPFSALLAASCFLVACSGQNNDSDPNGAEGDIHAFALGCFAVAVDESPTFLAASAAGDRFESTAPSEETAARFFMKPADLGVYLLFDQGEQYLTSDGTELLRTGELGSDTTLEGDAVVVDDLFESGAEWALSLSENDPSAFHLRHTSSGNYLLADGSLGSVDDAADVSFSAQDGCAPFPELTVDAEGEISPPEFDDGSLFGFVETHAHLFSNFAFGGGGIFHGGPFHRLGVEHALPDCTLVHGEDGRRDLLGFAFNDISDLALDDLVVALTTAMTPDFNHATEGYPTFTAWPDAHRSATHQVQYYKWLERAYLSGLRLLVQHATTNQALCDLIVGVGAQPARYSCNDMVAVDRIIEETYALERYIDAQEGGPGQGWFRIVTSPAEARQIIGDGKLAVVLGIETSNVFDCFLVPPDGFERCDEMTVLDKLDEYYERGVRVLFPVHKFDNAFSAGDGDKRIIDLGNFVQTGHFSNFGECDETVPTVFDKGSLNFPGLNMPREVYDSPPPNDLSGFGEDPIATLLPFIGLLQGPPLEGDFCQQAGLTPLGEFMLAEIMSRGIVLEVDHMPRLSYKRAFEILVENDYPAAGTHGLNNNGLLYELGGVSKSNFGRCRSATEQATMDDGFQERVQLMRDRGAFAAEGFGFDLNGFAGAPGPRFGENSVCDVEQTDPITYPFTSYAGDITFTEPRVGDRVLDFNTEGMVHLGLVAELIEDVRRDGVTDEELEPLFKSAEGYIRMWEKSEARGQALMVTP